jgi:hypothetical protein
MPQHAAILIHIVLPLSQPSKVAAFQQEPPEKFHTHFHTPLQTPSISNIISIEVLINFENINPFVQVFFDQSAKKAHMQSKRDTMPW